MGFKSRQNIKVPPRIRLDPGNSGSNNAFRGPGARVNWYARDARRVRPVTGIRCSAHITPNRLAPTSECSCFSTALGRATVCTPTLPPRLTCQVSPMWSGMEEKGISQGSGLESDAVAAMHNAVQNGIGIVTASLWMKVP